ncbi:MAG: hypothetical protein RQ847_05845 [Wenzhouxiangellaceae bacterium]|nr:hypothetical protein [Wenzhouxiangellaceae bacterium]
MFKIALVCGRTGLLALAVVMTIAAADPLAAQGSRSLQDREQERSDDEARQKTLDPRVAEDLLEAYKALENQEYDKSLERLNQLLNRRGESMKPFDKASVLQIRGTVHVNLDNMDRALEDYAAALELDALPADQQNRLRFNMAQIYFINERYREAIRLFEEWMQADVEVTDTTYFMLAASYYNLEEYEQVIEPIRKAIETASKPEKRYYDLLNSTYSQLGDIEARTRLLEEMVELWPGELAYWRQLSSLYSEQGDQMKAFAALEAAYVNGLIKEESDIILLAQYYSTFDNPHRGAQLIAREMEAGRVERTVENLELLSQLWSQAREHAKAIPVLREAARLSDEGELSFRLGQALLANEEYDKAEQAFVAALDKGGLSDERTAQAWLLLGNARFSQAGPGDREQRQSAAEAFARAEQFGSTRRQAADWRQYIRAINQTEARQAALEREQSEVLEKSARERLQTACRARELAGQKLTEQCRELLSEGEQGGGDAG